MLSGWVRPAFSLLILGLVIDLKPVLSFSGTHSSRLHNRLTGWAEEDGRGPSRLRRNLGRSNDPSNPTHSFDTVGLLTDGSNPIQFDALEIDRDLITDLSSELVTSAEADRPFGE